MATGAQLYLRSPRALPMIVRRIGKPRVHALSNLSSTNKLRFLNMEMMMMTLPEFFAIVVSPQDKSPEKLTGIVGCLTLTSAAVDMHTAKKDQRATLYCQTKETPKPIALCTLSANGVHQFQLQHKFSVADEEPTFSVKGNLDIHLTGHFQSGSDEDESMLDYDSEEEEEACQDDDCEDEECPDLVKVIKEQVTKTRIPEPVAEPLPVVKTPEKIKQEQPVTKTKTKTPEKKSDPTSTKKRKEDPLEKLAPGKRVKATPVDDAKAMMVPKKAQTIKKVKGVSIEDLVIGKGAVAKNGKNVKMLYQGFLMNGTQFDECQSRKKPFKFRLGIGECIKGFDIGVEGMRVGGKRRIVIPAKMGYGQRGAPPTIPGNAALRFEIELVGA